MSVVGHQPPPFFKRGPAPLLRLVFFVSLSLALLIVDLQFKYLELLRQGLAVATYPLQRIAYFPVELAKNAGNYFTSLSALQGENAELKRRSIESAGEDLRHEQLVQENQRLRRLLEMKERRQAQGVVAEILYDVRDPFRRKVIIDRGAQHGLTAGQAVLDDTGVLGQVTRVYPLQAEVTLLSDKDLAIPVQIARTGLRAVAFGLGPGQMELRYLAANADVQNNDTLVTSGMDGTYPPGLPVARVVRVDRDAAYTFARILCEPMAGVEQHNLVLVTERREMPPPPTEPEIKEKVSKPVKKRKAKEH